MLDLFKAIGLGLVVLLPLANPLTTVALFLGLAGNMNSAERNRQSLMASVYVFAINVWVCSLLLTASWKSLKRTIKKGPNGPFNYCVCSSSVTGQRRNIMIDQINAAKAGTAPT